MPEARPFSLVRPASSAPHWPPSSIMGSSTSKDSFTPQQRFPRAINTRFVYDRVVSLRLQYGFWYHGDPQAFEIMDVETSHVLFKVPPKSTDPLSARRQRLLDVNSVPIVTMDEFPVGPDFAVYIPAVPLPRSLPDDDVSSPNRALCYFQTSSQPMDRPLFVELNDPRSGEKVRITVEGSFRSHRVLFWLERGVALGRSFIARAYLPPADKKIRKQNGGKTDFYQVDVAAGVDVALIVLACAALDTELVKKKSGLVISIPDDERTKMLAARHRGITPRDPKAEKVGFVGTDLFLTPNV